MAKGDDENETDDAGLLTEIICEGTLRCWTISLSIQPFRYEYHRQWDQASHGRSEIEFYDSHLFSLAHVAALDLSFDMARQDHHQQSNIIRIDR